MNPTEGQRSGAAAATAPVDVAEAVRRLASSGDSRQADLLPLLHALQREVGHVPDEMVPHVAAALNVSRADVHGVVTFYHDFRRTPLGRHLVKLCRAESCQARGARQVERLLGEALGVAMGATRDDGAVTLEGVYCLGLCAIGPAALVDGQPVARIGSAQITAIAEAVNA